MNQSDYFFNNLETVSYQHEQQTKPEERHFLSFFYGSSSTEDKLILAGRTDNSHYIEVLFSHLLHNVGSDFEQHHYSS